MDTRFCTVERDGHIMTITLARPEQRNALHAEANLTDGLEASNKGMFALSEVRALLGGPDAREGPKAFAEKRTPVWADPT